MRQKKISFFAHLNQLRAISQEVSSSQAGIFLFGSTSIRTRKSYSRGPSQKWRKILGFCFHWINKEGLENALEEVNELNPNYFQE